MAEDGIDSLSMRKTPLSPAPGIQLVPSNDLTHPLIAIILSTSLRKQNQLQCFSEASIWPVIDKRVHKWTRIDHGDWEIVEYFLGDGGIEGCWAVVDDGEGDYAGKPGQIEPAEDQAQSPLHLQLGWVDGRLRVIM